MSNKDQREAVKTLAIAVGVREAARRLGLNEDRVRQWSSRGKWFTTETKPQPPTVTNNQVTTVTKPSKALQEVLSERSHKTKLHLSKAVLKASKAFAGMPGEDLIKDKTSGSARNWTGVAKDVHGWGNESEEGKGLFGGLRIYANQAVIGVNNTNQRPAEAAQPQGQQAEETGQA